MSIVIKTLEHGEGIEMIYFGTVQGKEIIQIRNQIYRDKYKTEQYKYFIINKLQCTEYDVTADDILSIVKLDIQAATINPNIIMAIIESKYLQFSLTEAWYVQVEDYLSKIKSFNNYHSALSWIQDNL